MLRFYLKRAIFVVLIIALAVGYSLWKESRESAAREKVERYALIVAQLAVAETLHHDSDISSTDEGLSWQELKDSLLSNWNLSSDSLAAYVDSFAGHEEKLAAFWKQVRINVDSLTELELANLSPSPDSAVGSLEADSDSPDSEVTK